MSNFTAKIRRIRFWLGLRPGPRWWSLPCTSDPQLDLRGRSSKGREGRERGKKGIKGRGLDQSGLDPVPMADLEGARAGSPFWATD